MVQAMPARADLTPTSFGARRFGLSHLLAFLFLFGAEDLVREIALGRRTLRLLLGLYAVFILQELRQGATYRAGYFRVRADLFPTQPAVRPALTFVFAAFLFSHPSLRNQNHHRQAAKGKAAQPHQWLFASAVMRRRIQSALVRPSLFARRCSFA